MGTKTTMTPGERLLAMLRPVRPSREEPPRETAAASLAATDPEPAAEALRQPEPAPVAADETAASPESPAETEPTPGATTEPAAGEPSASVPPASPSEPDPAGDAKKTSGRGLLARLLGDKRASCACSGSSRPRRRWGLRGGPCHVGVDLSPSQLVCVRTRGQDVACEILGTAVVALPEGAVPGSPGFVDILRRTLRALCGSGTSPRVWVASQTTRSNVQLLTIPKVPSRQVDNAVFWTAKKEMGLDEGSMLFDFERRGELHEKGALRLGALAYTATRERVRRLREDFAKAGFPLTGITIEPFAHQTLFRRRFLPSEAKATAVLHVGRNWSRLEIGSQGCLIFVRVIKTSMAGMEQAIQEALETRGRKSVAASEPSVPPVSAVSPAASEQSTESVVDLDESSFGGPGLVLELDAPLEKPASPPAPSAPQPSPREVTPEQAREVMACLVEGCDCLDAAHPGYGLAEDDILEMLEPVASRLVRQVEMTLKHFRESLGYAEVTRLAVSGRLGASPTFLAYMGEQVGLPCIAFDPVARVAEKHPVPGMTAPGVVYAQALGLALADNAVTPNLLFTYREKAACRTTRATEQWTLVGLAVVLAAMAFFSIKAVWTSRRLEAEYQTVSRQLVALGGKPDLEAKSRKVDDLARLRRDARAYIGRRRIVGIWSEALALTPPDVTVGTLSAELGPPRPTGKAVSRNRRPVAAKRAGRLVLEGLITGDSRLYDSRLASYVVALEGSPLFASVSVQRNERETLENGDSGLHFVIALTLAENGNHAAR